MLSHQVLKTTSFIFLFIFLFSFSSAVLIDNPNLPLVRNETTGSGGGGGGNVTSVTSSTNCITVSPTIGDVVITFNTSCEGSGGGFTTDQNDELNTTGDPTFNSLFLSSAIIDLFFSGSRYLNIDASSGLSKFNSSSNYEFYRNNVLKFAITATENLLYSSLNLNNNDIIGVESLESNNSDFNESSFGNVTYKDGSNVFPDSDGNVSFGSNSVSFNKFYATEGFSMSTVGGAAARIPADSYFGAIDSQPNSGIYFDNTGARNFGFHILGTELHNFYVVNANSQGVFYHVPRTTDPSDNTLHDGSMTMISNGTGYYLKVYNETGDQWLTMAFAD